MTARVYDWEGSDEHRTIISDAWAQRGDVHTAVAEKFGIDRQDAKLANWRLAYGSSACATVAVERAELDARGTMTTEQAMSGYGLRGVSRLAEAEGAQQNETDGAAEALRPFARLAVVSGCLLSDMHHNLHRGEACPECGYKFEDIG